MAVFEHHGVRLFYEIVGDGEPVVLHTGAGGDRTMWRHAGYLDELRDFQMVLFDHRGHGQSDKPRILEAHRLEVYVADVVALLDHLALPRAAFWGYSDGCGGYEAHPVQKA